ncbi:hypothetical protein RHMOL_Rhmol12G0166900 [Rhododendron molle]|uniref:Uncharacterized protein n=1 Tax=Rhododendron molle TaxID=49168 RepID=A0ACC0LIW0_RHOML|nr:hypothetical protein RHMOL_Rhmol12G0166900 [Rhododendron molle]
MDPTHLNNFDHFESQPYELNSSFNFVPYHQFPSESSQIPPHQSSSSDLQPPTSQKKNKAQVQTTRKQNWSKEEDEALCKAWLRVSEDAAIGTDQARAKLWDRVCAEFNNILGYETGRISKGLMHRWAIIQQHINKYSSCERSIERNPISGCNAEQSIEAAKDLYYRTNGHQFKWYGCWLILKDTSKWFHHMQEQEGRKEKIAQRKKREGTVDVDEIVCPSNPSTPATPSSVGAPISLDDNLSPLNDGPTDLLRPTGRKETKNPRRMKKGDQSEGVNFILSEFSNMRKEQKELVQQEISVAAERERMKIQAN